MQKGLPDALDPDGHLRRGRAEPRRRRSTASRANWRRVGRSWPRNSASPAAELTFLPDRRQAFDNLNTRTNMPSIRGVVNTLLQTAKFGTPLAHSLRVLAAEFRDARMIRAEEKARLACRRC